MRCILLAVVVALAALALTPAPAHAAGCQKLVVYAASWCPACDRMRADLNAHSVVFTEHFVDKSPIRDREFRRRVAAAGVRLAYPRLEVGGQMLPRNYGAQTLIDRFGVCRR